MHAIKKQIRGDPFKTLKQYERALLADVDATLTRVFTRGAEYARKQGDMRSYRICLKYLQELERSNPQKRRRYHV